MMRSCARLCHVAGGELEQIQFLLGHTSVQTTERYLGCKQKLHHTVNDRMGLEIPEQSAVQFRAKRYDVFPKIGVIWIKARLLSCRHGNGSGLPQPDSVEPPPSQLRNAGCKCMWICPSKAAPYNTEFSYTRDC